MPQNTLLTLSTNATEKDLLNPEGTPWREHPKIRLFRLWNGTSETDQSAQTSKHVALVASSWNQENIFFLFEAPFSSLYVNPKWEQTQPAVGLWNFDVCEVFLKPNGSPHYFEYEASPLGQWLDVRILRPREEVDFEWSSSMQVCASIQEEKHWWRVVFRIPFAPLLEGKAESSIPKHGDIWRVNFFRVAGKEPARSYYAWQPTFTPEPDFHVPAAFGNLIFVKGSE